MCKSGVSNLLMQIALRIRPHTIAELEVIKENQLEQIIIYEVAAEVNPSHFLTQDIIHDVL